VAVVVGGYAGRDAIQSGVGDRDMGAALFIVPEREVPGLDVFVNGKALARIDEPEQLAERAGVPWLMDYFSLSPGDALASLIEEAGEAPPEGSGEVESEDDLESGPVEVGGPPPEEWFDAADGLASVRGILAYLEVHPAGLAEAAEVVDDLKEFEAVLATLAAESVRWHLAVDF